jgi:hypothetical protein
LIIFLLLAAVLVVAQPQLPYLVEEEEQAAFYPGQLLFLRAFHIALLSGPEELVSQPITEQSVPTARFLLSPQSGVGMALAAAAALALLAGTADLAAALVAGPAQRVDLELAVRGLPVALV